MQGLAPCGQALFVPPRFAIMARSNGGRSATCTWCSGAKGGAAECVCGECFVFGGGRRGRWACVRCMTKLLLSGVHGCALLTESGGWKLLEETVAAVALEKGVWYAWVVLFVGGVAIGCCRSSFFAFDFTEASYQVIARQARCTTCSCFVRLCAEARTGGRIQFGHNLKVALLSEMYLNFHPLLVAVCPTVFCSITVQYTVLLQGTVGTVRLR